LIIVFVNMMKDYTKQDRYNPYILDGRWNGTKQRTYPGKMIYASMDSQYGQEFTYSMWLYVEDRNFSNSASALDKHIFHKGDSQGSAAAVVVQGPGLWIDKSVNRLKLVMNSFYSLYETNYISNIPLNKWFHLTISLIGKNLDVYVNGELKHRFQLKGIPRLNYGDLYICNWGGFDGEMSSMRYFNRALQPFEIEGLVTMGPAQTECSSTSSDAPDTAAFAQRYYFQSNQIGTSKE
jgi:hypothetical protein